MKPFVAVLLVAQLLLVSCAYNRPYKAVNSPEKIENEKALLDIYPGDVRTNLPQYTNILVAWAGIITKTDAQDAGPDSILAVTTLDHHYFDWQQDMKVGTEKLLVSPRGEGCFQTEWLLRKKKDDATIIDAESFAAPGKLAIIYGVPEKIENGAVVLKYRYLRVIDKKDYCTDQYDYGRFGEPCKYIGK